MQEDSSSVESPSSDSDGSRPFDWSTESVPVEFRKKLDALDGAAIDRNISAYQGFGSFHSANVDDLVALDENIYTSPHVPLFATRVLSRSRLLMLSDDESKDTDVYKMPIERCEFGLSFYQQHFCITPEFVFINHGAFGGTLRGALAIKRKYESLMESQVVKFVDRELLPLIVYSVRCLAKFVNARPTQLVLLQNATYALNCAMNLIEKDDVVAFFDTEYLSVYKMMYFRCKRVGASFHEVPLSKYLHRSDILGDDEALTRTICSELPAGCTTVIFDYVTSTSALCLPTFTHIIPALRRRGVNKIIVDGAHSLLQIDLNFNDLPAESRPSVFVSNLHKWFSAPKSAGFMWINEDAEEYIRSVVVSHGAGEGLLSEFIWDGTRDYGTYLAIPAIIEFWSAQGLDRVRTHCAKLLHDAAAMLTSAFGSRPVARHAPFMSLVELPEVLQDKEMTAKHVQDLLHDTYKIEVPIKRVESRLYVRISAFVYNKPSDYVYLREALLGIARQYKQRRLLSRDAGVFDEKLRIPCDKTTRERNGCGLTHLEPQLKRRKTTAF